MFFSGPSGFAACFQRPSVRATMFKMVARRVRMQCSGHIVDVPCIAYNHVFDVSVRKIVLQSIIVHGKLCHHFKPVLVIDLLVQQCNINTKQM